MKYTFYFMFILFYCLNLSCAEELSSSRNIVEYSDGGYKAIKRVVRQDMSQPTEMPPPPPDMQQVNNAYESFSRRKREAKGVSGALPTRKG
ncbi:unnamed protein product, partial [Brenthis ino]